MKTARYPPIFTHKKRVLSYTQHVHQIVTEDYCLALCIKIKISTVCFPTTQIMYAMINKDDVIP